MRWISSLLLLVLLCTFVTACGSGGEYGVVAEESAEGMLVADYAPQEVVLSVAAAPAAMQAKQISTVATSLSTWLGQISEPEAAQYLIRTANLQMEVDSAPDIARQITEKAAALGGYASDQSNSKIGEDRYTVSLTIRVPVHEFEGAIADLQELGTVLEFRSYTQDVSEEFVDTSARMKALERTEERLLDHLNRSAKLEDIIKAEQEIGRVRANIEQMQGRLRFLSNRVNYSTVHITLQDTPRVQPFVPQQQYSMMSEISAASQSLVKFGQRMLSKAVWAAVWSPVWLTTLLVLIFGLRKANAKLRSVA